MGDLIQPNWAKKSTIIRIRYTPEEITHKLNIWSTERPYRHIADVCPSIEGT